MSPLTCDGPPALPAQVEVVGTLQPPPLGASLEPPTHAPAQRDREESPGLRIDPIHGAYPRVNPWKAFGASFLAWGLVGTCGLLLTRGRTSSSTPSNLPPPSLALALTDSRIIDPEGGGHQGGGTPPPGSSGPSPTPPRPAPVPPADAPPPSALPTEPNPPTPVLAPGSVGGTGTGSGPGTGSGQGPGIGTGTGAGAADGPGSQTRPAEPIQVPYTEIGFVKVINPTYPERARRVGLQGQVVVRVTIDENGVPYEFHVLGGEEMFAKEALKVLPQWRFTPVLHLGRRVRATFDAVLRFKLA